MKKLQKLMTALVLILFGGGVTFIITFNQLTDIYQKQLDEIKTNEVVMKTAEIQTYIDRYFVGDEDPSAMADAAASAMVSAAGDRWSYYISAADYREYMEKMNNAYVGIGVTIQQVEAGCEIMELTPGGSAEEAGVQVGDVMTKVDGEDIAELTVDEITNLVRGEPGTVVELTFLRGGEELTLSVERRIVEQDVTTGKLLDGDIGYVRILNFDRNCASQTIAVIKDLLGQGAKSLILDVRNNPGGYKGELVDVLDYLLPEGPLFRMVEYDGGEYVDYSDADCLDVPMVVLVNENTYSAAEFFAAALREYEAADIVGAKTCGKGRYQNTFRLSDGSAVVLSCGTYYTPNGESLADVGVTPDVETPMEEEKIILLYRDELSEEDDGQLQAAIKLLR